MAQTDRHTNGHGDSMTESAQWADSVKRNKSTKAEMSGCLNFFFCLFCGTACESLPMTGIFFNVIILYWNLMGEQAETGLSFAAKRLGTVWQIYTN